MAVVALDVRLRRRSLDRDLASGIAVLSEGAGPPYAAGRTEALATALTLVAQWLDAGE